jgi:Tfp pilus assembly PilM family ATPase
MSSFQNHIGINITASRMQLVEIFFNGTDFSLENVDEEFFDEQLRFDEKEIKIYSVLQNAFNELIMRKPVESKYISFTLPYDMFRIIQIPWDKSLNDSDFIEFFKQEFSVIFPKIPVDDMIFQYIGVQNRDKNNSDSVIVVALLKKIIRVINTFCSENNMILKFIDNAHFASDRLITLDDSIEQDDGILSIYLSGKYLSFIYSKGSIPIGFNVTLVNHLNEVIPSLVKELRSNRLSKFDLDITHVFMAGENISDSLINKAEDILNIKLNKLFPFEKIKLNPSLYDSKLFTEKSSSFSSAAGIAFRIA